MLAGEAVAEAYGEEPDIGRICVVMYANAVGIVTEVEVGVTEANVRREQALAGGEVLFSPDAGTEGIGRNGACEFFQAVVLGQVIFAVEPGNVAQVVRSAMCEAAIKAKAVVVGIVLSRSRARVTVEGAIDVGKGCTGNGVSFRIEIRTDDDAVVLGFVRGATKGGRGRRCLLWNGCSEPKCLYLYRPARGQPSGS